MHIILILIAVVILLIFLIGKFFEEIGKAIAMIIVGIAYVVK